MLPEAGLLAFNTEGRESEPGTIDPGDDVVVGDGVVSVVGDEEEANDDW